MSNLLAALRILCLPLALSVSLGLLVRTALVQTFSIPSASMSPTLEPGDHILVTPYGGLLASEPRAGDVVVFRRPSAGGTFFVKRIIAAPGDLLEIRDPGVFVDGRAVYEPYALRDSGHGHPLSRRLQAGEYFVMGDNRPNSVDSRSWGPLRREQIVGRARLIFWSSGTDAERTANAMTIFGSEQAERPVRWSRILTSVR